jgi:5-methylcytosine-specific restriction endonuclease McrA
MDRCAYCLRGNVKLTRDHMIPRARGGAEIPMNIVPACDDCNNYKADKSILDMLVMMYG